MNRSRFGLLGLFAIVFGLMAFGPAAAHAEEGSQWLLAEGVEHANGDVLVVKLIPFLEATIQLEAETTGVLHSKIAGVTVLFECSALEAENAKLLANGSVGKAGGEVKGSKVKFSGCITKLNGATSAACEPNANGTAPGVILTNEGHALIELHELAGGVKDELVRILPDTPETFAVIEMGEECSIGEKVPVIGHATLKDCENAFLVHKKIHLVEIGPLTALWTISKTTEHVATILGSSFVEVIQGGASRSFAGHAN